MTPAYPERPGMLAGDTLTLSLPGDEKYFTSRKQRT